MSTDQTPAKRLAAADARYRRLVRQAGDARIERDRLVYEFRNGHTMTNLEMAEVLRSHRSYPDTLATKFPDRERQWRAERDQLATRQPKPRPTRI